MDSGCRQPLPTVNCLGVIRAYLSLTWQSAAGIPDWRVVFLHGVTQGPTTS